MVFSGRKGEPYAKKVVALAGASGNMGYQGFPEFYKRKDRFRLVLLLRDSNRQEHNYYGPEIFDCFKERIEECGFL